MTQTLTLSARPNISHLKKQAKQLLKQYQLNDVAANEVVLSYFPQPDKFTSLRDAQLVIARQYGFAGWINLKTAVEELLLSELNKDELAEIFIDLACIQYNGADSDLRYQKAGRLLINNPWLASHNFICAIISNNLSEVKRRLSENSAIAHEPVQPMNWSPLMYLSYNRINIETDEFSESQPVLGIAQLLIENGADVNGFVLLEETYHFSVLTGVMGEGENGLVNQPAHHYSKYLARLLLDAGADPVESQGLYNTLFTDSADYWLALLMDHGLNKESLMGWSTAEKKQTLFNYLLGSAVSRDKVNRVAFLLLHGADANACCFYTNRKMLTIAKINRHEKITRLLLDAGAEPVQLCVDEAFMLAVVTENKQDIGQLINANPEVLNTPELIQGASIDVLQQLITLGFDINTQDESGRSLLHLLAIHGKLEQIIFLVEQGASVDLRDNQHQGAVVAWAHFNDQVQVRDYLLHLSTNTLELSACGFIQRLQQVIDENPASSKQVSTTGNTPLHLVCNWLGTTADYETRKTVMRLLLDNGAELNVKNNNGLTPLDLYRQENDEDNIELLLGYLNK